METTAPEAIQVSFPLPRGMDTKIHMRLTIQSKAILLFITTVAAEDLDKPAPMGSFVYALPDVCPPRYDSYSRTLTFSHRNTIQTSLYQQPSTQQKQLSSLQYASLRY